MEEEKSEQPKTPQELSADSPTLPRSYGDMVGSDSGPKRAWPELVGLTAEEGEKKIKEEKPGAQIQIVPADSFVTMDFRLSRVRLFVDSHGKIARPPTCG